LLIPIFVAEYAKSIILGTIKKSIVIVLLLLAILAVISIFLPSRMQVEEARILHTDQKSAFQLVNDLHQWKYWSPWHRLDPNTIWHYNEIPSGTGASYTWKSEKRSVGKGKMTIVESRPDDYLKTEMDFGPKGVATSEMFFEKVPEGIQLKWTMSSNIGWNPIGKYVSIFMKGMVAKSYDEGLKNIEIYLKKQDNLMKPAPTRF